MITTGESDSHLDGIDGGDLAAARVEVLLEVRQEDSKARKICDLMSNHMASLIIETYALIIIVITLMIMIITSQESRRGLLKSAGEPVKMITCT